MFVYLFVCLFYLNKKERKIAFYVQNNIILSSDSSNKLKNIIYKNVCKNSHVFIMY